MLVLLVHLVLFRDTHSAPFPKWAEVYDLFVKKEGEI